MKMPMGVSAGAVKTHMEVRWGLGRQWQKSVLVTAVSMQPASRLLSEIDAKKVFDDVARTYASLAGMDLSSTSIDAGPGLTLDLAASNALTEHQRKLDMRCLGNIYVWTPRSPTRRSFEHGRMLSPNSETKLDLWINEHGDFDGRGYRNLLGRRRGSKTRPGIGYETMFHVFVTT